MKQHTSRAFDTLTVAYPTWGERFDTAGIEAWGRIIEEIPAEQLATAISHLVRTSKFPPSIADIFAASGVTVPPPVKPFVYEDEA